jgi:hypothetical protein
VTYAQVTIIDGDPVPAQVINDLSAEVAGRSGAGLGVLKRGNRTSSSSTTTTTEIGVLRVDAISISPGRLYRISTSPLIFNSSVANDLIQAGLRYTTSGTAGTGSTQLTALVDTSYTGSGSQRTKSMVAYLVPAAAAVLSVLLTVVRGGGTGSVSLNATTAYPMDLVVEDMGLDPGNTGTSL